MKIGVIIICYNNEFNIDRDLCISYLKEVQNIEFCLVNNYSQDNTFEVLKELSETCKNVSVVNINKYKSNSSAVRAGARFMCNEFNLKYLGFITENTFGRYNDLSLVIKAVQENQLDVSNYNRLVLNTKEIKLAPIKNLTTLPSIPLDLIST